MKRLSCMPQGIVQHWPVRGAGIGAVPQTHVLWWWLVPDFCLPQSLSCRRGFRRWWLQRPL